MAVKFLPRGPDKVTKHVERELRSHSSFCHPHVVLFKEVFLTQSHLAIVMVCLFAAGSGMQELIELQMLVCLSVLFTLPVRHN